MRSRAGREVDLSAHESVASQRAAPRMTAAPAELAPTPPPPEAPLAYRLTRRVTEYARLMRLDRPVGTWLLLWPALWALWIAGAGRPRPKVLGIFVLGVVVMRAAGCVINDFLDRNIDAYVQRTRDRPLAARRVAPGEALTLFALLLLAALYLVSRLERADGLRGPDRRAAAGRLGAVHRRGHLDGHVRHALCHGRPRGRPEDRREVERGAVRRHGQAPDRRDAGDDARRPLPRRAQHALRRRLLGGPRRRRRAVPVAAVAHPQARARGVFPRVSE